MLQQWGQGGSNLADVSGICFVNLNKRHLESIILTSRLSRILHFLAISIGFLFLLKKDKVLLRSMTESLANCFLDTVNAPFESLIAIGNNSKQSILQTNWNQLGRRTHCRWDSPMGTFQLKGLQVLVGPTSIVSKFCAAFW